MTDSRTRPDGTKAWITYAALLFSTFVTLEAAAFQVPALPTVAAHYGIPTSIAALFTVFYYLGVTVFSPVMGRLADHVGRKRIIMIGLVIFTLAEFVAATSPPVAVFLLARFFQGLGVACILPVTMAFIGYLFAPGKRGLALGVFGTMTSVGVTVGAVLSGWLVDSYGWPVIYLISGVLSLAGLGLTACAVDETPVADGAIIFDTTGVVLLFIAIGALLAVPSMISVLGPGTLWAPLAVVVIATALWLLWRQEWRARQPVLDMAILCHPVFRMTVAVQFLYIACIISVIYTLAFFIQQRPGGSATQVGLVTMFIYGSGIVSPLVVGKLIDLYRPKTVAVGLTVLAVLAVVMLNLISAQSPLWYILIAVSILGFAVSGMSPTLIKIALGVIPEQKLGAGTGLYSMIRDLGTPAGAAVGLALYGHAAPQGPGEAFTTVTAVVLALQVAVLALIRWIPPVQEDAWHGRISAVHTLQNGKGSSP